MDNETLFYRKTRVFEKKVPLEKEHIIMERYRNEQSCSDSSKTSMELNNAMKPVSTLPCGDPL